MPVGDFDHEQYRYVTLFCFCYTNFVFSTIERFLHCSGSTSGFSEKALQCMTVERLRLLLRERGLSPKGRKVELFMLPSFRIKY